MPFLGNIGPGELILLLVIILVIFGPGKLPEIGQAVGKGIREFRRASSDVAEATRLEPAPPAPTPGATAPAAPAIPPAAPATAPAPADESHGDASQQSA
jgi:sec-independent protein translocase protein TatA